MVSWSGVRRSRVEEREGVSFGSVSAPSVVSVVAGADVFSAGFSEAGVEAAGAARA